MRALAEGPFVRRTRFAEADEAAASIPATDLRFSLLAAPQRDWTLLEARLNASLMLAGETGAALTATGFVHQRVVSFCLALSLPRRWTMNGHGFDEHCVACVADASEIAVSTDMPVNWI